MASKEEYENDYRNLQAWQDDNSNHVRDSGEYVEITDKLSLNTSLRSTDMVGDISLVSVSEDCPTAMKLRVDLSLVAVPAPTPTRPGDWDTGKAMAQIYGNYNQAERISIWMDAPKAEHPELDPDDLVASHGLIAVRPALAVGFTEDSKNKYLLVTTASPANVEWSCHACESTIGAFEFVSDNDGWTLEASNKELDYVDSGQLPSVHLLPVGWNRYGFTFATSQMANGGDGQDSAAIVVPVAGKLVLALGVDTTDYEGGDRIETNGIYVLPSRDVEAHPEYYNLKITTNDLKKNITDFAIYSFDKASGKYLKMDPRPPVSSLATFRCYDALLGISTSCWN
jgi:hypothetical protein